MSWVSSLEGKGVKAAATTAGAAALIPLLVFLLAMVGCATFAVDGVGDCVIVKHTFLSFNYWSDVNCADDGVYDEAHEIPAKTIYDELTNPEDEQ